MIKPVPMRQSGEPTRNIENHSLKNCHLLSRLSGSQIERVKSNAVQIFLNRGQELFNQGDAVDCFYLVIKGRVMLSRTSPQGEEKTIEFVPAGHVFAEALMFRDQASYPVTATAIEKSEVIGINAADFRSMLRESIDTCFLLLGEMCARMHSLIHEIDTLSLHTGACRVATFLMKNLSPGSNVVELSITKKIIASRLSVKPETFSRILHEMQERGEITVEGRTITIHDQTALASLCIQDD